MTFRLRSHTFCPRCSVQAGVRYLQWLLVAFTGPLLLLAFAGCAHVTPSERERLASPAMRFEMDPVADGQRDSVHEITEGGTFPSAGPGNAGAGCGCN